MKTEEKSEAEHLDKVKQALREVAQRHGMTDAHLNPYEGLGLELHDGQEICLEYVADRHKLFIYTPLMELVRDTVKRQAMLEVALQMNCLESGAASSALHQARPFNPHGGGRIQSWDALWDLLDQGPPFPAKMFDGMLTFLSREGKDWMWRASAGNSRDAGRGKRRAGPMPGISRSWRLRKRKVAAAVDRRPAGRLLAVG